MHKIRPEDKLGNKVRLHIWKWEWKNENEEIPQLDIINIDIYEYNRMIKDNIIIKGWVTNVGKVWCE